MKSNRIDGILFGAMMAYGLDNLRAKENEINAMNVFPVADGDTGTNMRLTTEGGVFRAEPEEHLGNYLKKLSRGMLLGARGNSGVILSQIFKGFSDELAGVGVANPSEIKNALIRAYKTAYAAVIRPVEGTLLTVAREGIENVKEQIVGGITAEQTFSLYLAAMKKSQQNTPELLPVLKESGVLDSGAAGYIAITEGMVKYLRGEKVGSAEEKKVESTTHSEAFDENSEFTLGYCTEFMLRLMRDKKYLQGFDVKEFTQELKAMGESIAVVRDGTLVKVHIHTFKPADVITLAQKYGEFVAFKLENMQLQHNETKLAEKAKNAAPRIKLGIIAVADGDGLKELYKGLGANVVIDGGRTMNASAEEFLSAYSAVNAERIAVFPNNPNVRRAAEQAAAMYEDPSAITVIPTADFAECYFALAMDIGDAEDTEARTEAMRGGAESATTVLIATAVKDYSSGGFSCRKGDRIAFLGKEPTVSSDDPVSAAEQALSKVPDIDEKSAAIVITGKNFTEDDEARLSEVFGRDYPDVETTFVSGGQSVYEIVIGMI